MPKRNTNKLGNKKERIFTVLNNSSLSTQQKVDEILKIQQEGKVFKDVGPRVPGSRKEGAALRTIYNYEDKIYKEKLSKAFYKYKLSEEVKRKNVNSAFKKYKYESGTQRLIEEGDYLRSSDDLKDALKRYLEALNLIAGYRNYLPRGTEELWFKKAIFMTSNGMAIAYSKLGKPLEAIECFKDAIKHAPTKVARGFAEDNLKKLKEAYEKKTGSKIHTL
jgi:tetratricopeptide (TPR) repeat protein